MLLGENQFRNKFNEKRPPSHLTGKLYLLLIDDIKLANARAANNVSGC